MPQPLSYLQQTQPNNFDLELEVGLRAASMNQPARICRTNFKYMYWSSVQQLMHHASSGCAMNIGDLLGSGTISGPEKSQRGSLLEISWNSCEPLELADGVVRTFLEDGDRLRCAAGAKVKAIGSASVRWKERSCRQRRSFCGCEER
jgi:fumarylacetoacetase